MYAGVRDCPHGTRIPSQYRLLHNWLQIQQHLIRGWPHLILLFQCRLPAWILWFSLTLKLLLANCFFYNLSTVNDFYCMLIKNYIKYIFYLLLILSLTQFSNPLARISSWAAVPTALIGYRFSSILIIQFLKSTFISHPVLTDNLFSPNSDFKSANNWGASITRKPLLMAFRL